MISKYSSCQKDLLQVAWTEKSKYGKKMQTPINLKLWLKLEIQRIKNGLEMLPGVIMSELSPT